MCAGGVAPPTQEVGRAIVLWVWWSGTDVIVCILMLSRLCCVSGNVCGLPVGFRWSVKFSLRTGVLEEQDGVVFGVSWPLPSSHWSTSLPALGATPLQQTRLNGRGWISCTSSMSFMWFRWPLVLLVGVLP